MKRLTDFLSENLTGGAPFFNEDFYSLQEEIYAVLNGFAQSLSENYSNEQSIVLDGCEITGAGPYDVAAGIVYINDGSSKNLYRFPGASGVTAGNKYIIPDTEAVTQRLYNDGGTKNFFKEQVATIGANQTGAIEFDPSLDNLPRIGISGSSVINVNALTGIAANRVLGRISGGVGDVEELQGSDIAALLTGLIDTAQLANDAVTYAKMQNITGERILGRDNASAGIVEELTPTQVFDLLNAAGVFSSLLATKQDIPGAWNTFSFSANWQGVAGGGTGYRLESGGVRFRGQIQFTGGGNPNSGDVWATLPVGFRPQRALRITVAPDGVGDTYKFINIATNGQCDVWEQGVSFGNPMSGDFTYLDGGWFDIDSP